ncbi:MAG: RidA family protein [Clostridium perfringens]|nr:RidA family protein [Clostridium perfringens]
MKKIINTKNAPGAIGPYSQGTECGNLIFVSGQLPIDMSTGKLATEIKAATKASLDNVKAILEEAGSSMNQVLKTTVLLKDINDFAAVNEVYGTYFTKDCPARACFQVGKLPKDALVEIEVIACK